MLTAVRQYILKEILKQKPKGIVTSLPNKDLVEMNVQITAQFLMQNGIDPTVLKNANQVENAIKSIDNRPKVQEGIKSTKTAKVFDLEGKEIKDTKNIMGGKEIKETEAEIAARMSKENKEAAERLREKSMAKAFSDQDLKEMDQAIFNLTERQGISGDSRVDAEFLAEELAALRGIKYDDMPIKEKASLYGQAYDRLQRDKFLKKNPIDDTEDFAQGGRAGFKDGPKLTDFLNIQAAGSKTGKQQIQGAPAGITKDSEFIEAIVKLDIPFNEKVNLLADYSYGKGRNRIEKDNQEIFLDEGGFKNRNVGLEFNKSGGGFGGKIMYNLETGEPQLDLRFTKPFASGGRAGFKFGIGPLIELLSKTSPKQAYTKYLKSVKDRAQKGDMKSLVPELGALSATGIFVNRRMKDVLENMKNQDMENNLENFKKELDADPFYKEYPELKDKMIEGYTEMMFGEKRADGGRIGLKNGMDRRTFLKIMGGLASIPILGKFFKGAKVASKAAPVVNTVSKSTPPPYFFELAETIKKFGKVSEGPQERIKIHSMPSKDGKSELMLTEDIGTGEMQIKKIGKENDEMITEIQTMDYSPSSALSDESGMVPGNYDEFTEYNSKIYKDEFNDPEVIDGIKVDEIIEEVREAPPIKKAGGGIARMLGE